MRRVHAGIFFFRWMSVGAFIGWLAVNGLADFGYLDESLWWGRIQSFGHYLFSNNSRAALCGILFITALAVSLARIQAGRRSRLWMYLWPMWVGAAYTGAVALFLRTAI